MTALRSNLSVIAGCDDRNLAQIPDFAGTVVRSVGEPDHAGFGTRA